MSFEELTDEAMETLTCILRHRLVDTTMLQHLLDITKGAVDARLRTLRGHGLADRKTLRRPGPHPRWQAHRWYATERGKESVRFYGGAPEAERPWLLDPDAAPTLYRHLEAANEFGLILVRAAREHDDHRFTWKDWSHEVAYRYRQKNPGLTMADIILQYRVGQRTLGRIVEIDRGTLGVGDVQTELSRWWDAYGYDRGDDWRGSPFQVWPQVVVVVEKGEPEAERERLEAIRHDATWYPEPWDAVGVCLSDLLEHGPWAHVFRELRPGDDAPWLDFGGRPGPTVLRRVS